MNRLALALAFCVACTGGSADDQDGEGTTDPNFVAEFGTTTSFTVVATSDDKLDFPRDLEFHPVRTNELWVANTDTDAITVLYDPDTEGMSSEKFADAVRNHFMEEVSSIAIGD